MGNKLDGRREMREIVVLLARGAGIFSTCADTISRKGTAFNPNYEAVSMALGLVYDCIDPLIDRLGAFIVGLEGGKLNIADLDDTELQFGITLWNQLSDLAPRLAKVATESVYEALRTNSKPELWNLAQDMRQLDAVANLSGKLHFAQLDETEAAKELVLQQLREFVSPKLIDDWASLGPDLRRK